MNSKIKRVLVTSLGVLVTVFFLWLFLKEIELDELSEAVFSLSLSVVVLALLFLAIDYFFRIVRWWLMLKVVDKDISLKSCAWPFLVSIAVNNIIPFRAGDAVRVIGFRKQLNAPMMRLLSTLMIERVLDLMALLFFFFVFVRGIRIESIPSFFIDMASLIAICGVICIIATLLFTEKLQVLINYIADLSYFVKKGWGEKIRKHSNHFLEPILLLRTPKLLIMMLILSLLVWTLEGVVFVTITSAISPEAELSAGMFSLSLSTLATLLPSSPGYVGTFDYFAMLGLVAYGVSKLSASAIALTVHFILWLPLTLSGLLYLLGPGEKSIRKQIASDISLSKLDDK